MKKMWGLAVDTGLLLGIYQSRDAALNEARSLQHSWTVNKLKKGKVVSTHERPRSDGGMQVSAMVARRWWQQTTMYAAWLVYEIHV